MTLSALVTSTDTHVESISLMQDHNGLAPDSPLAKDLVCRSAQLSPAVRTQSNHVTSA